MLLWHTCTPSAPQPHDPAATTTTTQGTNKGDARGFTLEALDALHTTKSPAKNMTLMDYVVQTLERKVCSAAPRSCAFAV